LFRARGIVTTHTWEEEKIHPFTLGEDWGKLSLVLILLLCFESLRKGQEVLKKNKKKFNKKNSLKNQKN
jgi:hypothetical protein